MMYEGNPQRLIDANNQACGDDETDYPGGQTQLKLPGFHGFNLYPRSLKEECEVWEFLEITCKTRMKLFGNINEAVELQKTPVPRNIRNIMWIRE